MNDRLTILTGDALAILKTLPSESVQCCVTSPPYWMARNYGVPHGVWGGDASCDHKWDERSYYSEKTLSLMHAETRSRAGEENAARLKAGRWKQDAVCACGAWRGCLGMEPTPEAFVEHLCLVFDEVRRTLKPGGCLWVNMGDSYAAGGIGGGGNRVRGRMGWADREAERGWRSAPQGYKEKDLIGVPFMLSFALRARGWYFRRDVIWSKGAATEPTRADRPSCSHEFLFLLTKSKRYDFDSTALPHGSVWHISPQGVEGHSAAYPPSLIKPCILAGSKAGDTIIDPFGGSGTTGMVALEEGRRAILIELNPSSADLIEQRCGEVTFGLPLTFSPSSDPAPVETQEALPL